MGEWNGLFEAGCVIIVFPAVLAAGTGNEIAGWQGRLCRFMGDLSYPLYIIHYPFIYLFAHWNWNTHPAPVRLGLVATALYFAVVALAYALTRWYDRPVRAWLTRLSTEQAMPGRSGSSQQIAAVPAPATE
jgi:peptidoglycan/LPS O-acetylase OafA/YrhL